VYEVGNGQKSKYVKGKAVPDEKGPRKKSREKTFHDRIVLANKSTHKGVPPGGGGEKKKLDRKEAGELRNLRTAVLASGETWNQVGRSGGQSKREEK